MVIGNKPIPTHCGVSSKPKMRGEPRAGSQPVPLMSACWRRSGRAFQNVPGLLWGWIA
jgi:hypothetical protein